MLRSSKVVYYAITTYLVSPPFRFVHSLTYQTTSAFLCLANHHSSHHPDSFLSPHCSSSSAGASFSSHKNPRSLKSPYDYCSYRTTTTTAATTRTTNRTTSTNNTQRNMSNNSLDSSPTKANDEIATNIAHVKSKIQTTLQECNRSPDSVRLVAVSKTKPVEMLMEAYQAGQRHFGENYAQELMQKAEEMPNDVQWHFIGPLQSNKAGPLVKSLGLKKLVCVESVSSMKLAQKLDHAVQAWLDQHQEQQQPQQKDEKEGESGIAVLSDKEKKLGIYLQVNTSGEDTKSGVSNEKECADLAKEIVASCPNLRIDGLMTIGAPGDFSCFDVLVECRKSVADVLSVDVDSLELSMGMSGDYVEAIQRGATSVRVGSTIFGARDYAKK
mmetsp:Transcript_12490/g.23438  ORF Transcript_12490/g.23438 Transcript_12490/m.23438 type:complete len:384 (+) Transcript_12490:21-1172(+)